MKHDVVQAIVQADPEAFGVAAGDEPQLGCATTGQLITELAARCDDDPGIGDALAMIRAARTGAQLAYRTIDH